jgi:hypothetical protein
VCLVNSVCIVKPFGNVYRAAYFNPQEIMKVLVACEESQAVCIEFRKLGVEAYSNDLLPCSGGHPEWHLQMDCFDAIDLIKPNLLIAHPECTRLTVAANKYYKPEYASRFPTINEDREQAVKFFMRLINCDVEHIAVENPIGIMSSRYKKPSQIFHPYHFGDPERKSTCLWLKNLPPLIHTDVVAPVIVYHKSGRTDGRLHFETLKLPKEERRKARSKTFPGIAKAMATQWTEYLLSQKPAP